MYRTNLENALRREVDTLRKENVAIFSDDQTQEALRKSTEILENSDEANLEFVFDTLFKFFNDAKLTTMHIPRRNGEMIYFSHGTLRMRSRSNRFIKGNESLYSKTIDLLEFAFYWKKGEVSDRVLRFFKARKRYTAKAAEYRQIMTSVCSLLDSIAPAEAVFKDRHKAFSAHVSMNDLINEHPALEASQVNFSSLSITNSNYTMINSKYFKFLSLNKRFEDNLFELKVFRKNNEPDKYSLEFNSVARHPYLTSYCTASLKLEMSKNGTILHDNLQKEHFYVAEDGLVLLSILKDLFISDINEKHNKLFNEKELKEKKSKEKVFNDKFQILAEEIASYALLQKGVI
jgi:hypothetical protein